MPVIRPVSFCRTPVPSIPPVAPPSPQLPWPPEELPWLPPFMFLEMLALVVGLSPPPQALTSTHATIRDRQLGLRVSMLVSLCDAGRCTAAVASSDSFL